MAPGLKVGIVGTVALAMFSVAGYGAYNIYTGLEGDSGSSSSTTQSAGKATADAANPVSADDAAKTAKAFLSAWSAGDVAEAAGFTTDAPTATAVMQDFSSLAAISKITATPKAAETDTSADDSTDDAADGSADTASGSGSDTATDSAATVPFTVKATVTYQKLPPKVWTYDSALTVGRDADGKPAVTWAPSVLEPDLKDGETVVTGRASAPQVDLVDKDGTVMTAADYPGLTDVFADLRERYADEDLGGTPGIETRVLDADGNAVKTLLTVKAGKNAQLKTTLDAHLQAAAEKAVKRTSPAGVTALDTRTGKILAMASNPPAGQNYALSLKAPGSTFKIVTATAILRQGFTPNSTSQCVSGFALHGGKPYKNVTPNNTSATLGWDFAKSCNTGFIRLEPQLPTGFLPDTAKKYFGIAGKAEPWYIGTGTPDGSVPGGTGDELSSEMIGQGQVVMTTLNMASIAATVRNGSFNQPTILQDTGMIDKRTHISTSPLPANVRAGLQTMMKRVVDNGTATGILTHVASPYGAKTGSAEESQEGEPNGWFTAYSDHVAAAALVIGGGHGGDSAGPIVTDVLRAAS